ncbi:MAG TPA: hypothetical protein VEK56_10305, partial [Vicinamibacterales bacterium]|nr:hypothetical protein [Vicinamibacterales bacterium]
MRRLTALITAVALACPAISFAQEPQGQSIDASKMGVSLDRIRRELRQTESTESVNGQPLKLNFRVDVFGTAPQLDLIPEDFSLTYGPVPHSAPTHREHIEYVTPQEFRAPAIPIYGLAIWAAQKLAERSKKA